MSNNYKKNNDYLDITQLIRSIQRAENNIDCFRKESNDCDQFDCAWRDYCLNVNQIPSKEQVELDNRENY